MKKIRIHCFEPTGIEGFPSNTYETSNIDSTLACIKNILTNERSGISRIVVENPNCDSPIWGCYGRINSMAPMNLDEMENTNE